MKFTPMESVKVHVHHAPREDGSQTKHECLGSTELKRGDAFGGELAGGFFYVGFGRDGDIVITFVNTCHPENLEAGEIGEGE
jgi:hypothetical protein